MSDTTPQRVHLFHDTHLLATFDGPTTTPQPYYTLDDGTVLQAISYLTVTHTDGTLGLDVEVVPVHPQPTAERRPAPTSTRYRA